MNNLFDIIHKSGETLLFAATPLLLSLLVISVLMGLLQSILQLQDAVIGFVPKLTVLLAALVLGGGLILERFGALMRETLVALGAVK